MSVVEHWSILPSGLFFFHLQTFSDPNRTRPRAIWSSSEVTPLNRRLDKVTHMRTSQAERFCYSLFHSNVANLNNCSYLSLQNIQWKVRPSVSPTLNPSIRIQEEHREQWRRNMFKVTESILSICKTLQLYYQIFLKVVEVETSCVCLGIS